MFGYVLNTSTPLSVSVLVVTTLGPPTTNPNFSRAFVVANNTTMSAINNSYIVSWSYFKMEIVRPKKFVKETMQTTVTVPAAKDTETTRAFQWMLFKPQLHAVTPFETN